MASACCHPSIGTSHWTSSGCRWRSSRRQKLWLLTHEATNRSLKVKTMTRYLYDRFDREGRRWFSLELGDRLRAGSSGRLRPGSEQGRCDRTSLAVVIADQRPTIPPSFLVMTMVAERGRAVDAAPDWVAGQLLSSVARLPFSPGCWMLTKSVRPSGVESTPVSFATLRADQEALQRARGRGLADDGRLVAHRAVGAPMLVIVFAPPSPTLPGCATSIWLLVLSVKAPSSVWIHRIGLTWPEAFCGRANHRPSGLEKSFACIEA